jgi:rsbT co-antagonist protein RsbR
MHTLVATLLTVRHPDPDVRRRGQNLVVLHAIELLLALLSIPATLAHLSPQFGLLIIGVCEVVFLSGLLLARAGRVTLSAWLLVAIWLGSTLAVPLSTGLVSVIPAFLPGAILLAGVTMRPRTVGAVLALCLGALLLMRALAAAYPQPPIRPDEMVGYGVILTLFAAMVALVGNITSTRALDAAKQAYQRAEQAAAERDTLNARLEAQVQERTAALERALQEVEARAAQQALLLEEVGLQRAAIRELSVPVLPVGKDTLVLPLVGAVDSARRRDVQERALDSIQAAGARRLILDVTGTPVIDSQVAQGLLALVQGAKLLGAEVLLVGMRPEVAQTIVSLGLDIAGVQTFRDLHAALEQFRPLAHLPSDARRHAN